MKDFQVKQTVAPMTLPNAISFSNFLTKHKKEYYTSVRKEGTQDWVVTNKFDPRNVK